MMQNALLSAGRQSIPEALEPVEYLTQGINSTRWIHGIRIVFLLITLLALVVYAYYARKAHKKGNAPEPKV